MVDKTVKELRESIINILCAGSVHQERIDFEQTNEFKIVDFLIASVRVECAPVIYGIFTAGKWGTLVSQVQDRADSGHCDLHYGGLIEDGKRYGLILLPEKGKYVSAPIFKEEKKP